MPGLAPGMFRFRHRFDRPKSAPHDDARRVIG